MWCVCDGQNYVGETRSSGRRGGGHQEAYKKGNLNSGAPPGPGLGNLAGGMGQDKRSSEAKKTVIKIVPSGSARERESSLVGAARGTERANLVGRIWAPSLQWNSKDEPQLALLHRSLGPGGSALAAHGRRDALAQPQGQPWGWIATMGEATFFVQR